MKVSIRKINLHSTNKNEVDCLKCLKWLEAGEDIPKTIGSTQ